MSQVTTKLNLKRNKKNRPIERLELYIVRRLSRLGLACGYGKVQITNNNKKYAPSQLLIFTKNRTQDQCVL